MIAELESLIEREIRGFLSRQGPRPPWLSEASLDHHHASGRTLLSLIFSNGDYSVDLPYSPHLSAGHRRVFSRDCVTLYSQLYENHIIAVDLGRVRERIERMMSMGAPPAAIERARRDYFQQEEHLRRYHRRPAAFVAGWCEPPAPIEPITSCGHSTNTLRLEDLERAMRHMAEPPRVRGYDVPYEYLPIGDRVGGEAAQARALDLLKRHLTPAQRAQYESHRHFEVRGCDTGKRYRIRHGRQMNIDELDAEGTKVCGWCFLPQGALPAGDVMLAQKISLECDEAAALKVANRFSDVNYSIRYGGGIQAGRVYGFSPAAVFFDDVV